MFAPITAAMIEVGEIGAGESVLDVAGGVGEPALTIAEAVGPAGSVTCTDIAEEMVAAAQRESRRQNKSNLLFKSCAADCLPFPDRSFDHTTCRLGAMFFPDPRCALAEMLRVTKPAGSVTLAAWSRREANPFFGVVTRSVSEYVPSPPEEPDSPGAFRFEERGRLARIFRESGAQGVNERMLAFDIEADLSFDEFWAIRSQMSESLRGKLRQLDSDELGKLISDLRRATSPYFKGGRMLFPAEVIVITGKPE
jgi:SAM-dependent methyltransferase